jgi:hypothetical protein
MDPSEKSASRFLLALGIFLAGAWLGWRALSCFDDAIPWWRGRIMDRYVETPGQVDRVFLNKIVEAKRRTVVSQQIILEGRFSADGVERFFSGIDRVLYHNREAEAIAAVEEIRRTRKQTSVLFDAENPENHVLHREFLPGTFQVALMGLLGSLVLIVGLALVVIGAKLVLAIVLPAALHPGSAPPPWIGDPLKDYYSGALEALAWKQWEGYRCRIFLMPDRTLIAIHDESTHHRAERWSLTDVLKGRTDIHFDETQEDARRDFFECIREEEQTT